jgi:hypothetical protein
MDVLITDTRNGKGIVAARNFSDGETVFEVTGPLLTCNEDEDIDEKTRSNTFRFDEDFYINPAGTVGDFQNHSCEPNAMVVKRDDRLFVVAGRQIKHGEEVLIDYSTIIGEDDSWEMLCNCGSRICRGVVKGFDSLPRKLQQLYFDRGMVPEYIAAP